MVIIINKDYSIAQVTPSTVYQGSNLANELTVFAPFSVSSYSSIIATFKLPSGEYIEPLVVFATVEQPQGFGAWSVLLPASVTAIPGTVKFSLSFIGSGDVRMVTGEAEFSVNASVPNVLPATPSANIYESILAELTSILERHPDWDESSQTSPSYIANKPPIVQLFNALDALIGAKVNGDLNVTGGLVVNELSIFSELVTALNGFLVTGGLMVDGVDFSDKLTKRSETNAVYVNVGSTPSTIPYSGTAQGYTIPRRTSLGALTAADPATFSDSDFVVNTRYFNANSATQIAYDASTGVLSLKKRDGTVIGYTTLPLDIIVSNVEYDNTNENLVITFTNGQTTVIPLQSLLLPAWVSNLNNIPNGSGNVPPTADAVKEYAAPVVRNTVTGTAFVVDDYAENINNNYISATSATSVKIYGKNLVDPTQIRANSGNSYLIVNGNEITWKAGATYNLVYNVFIPKGSTVTLLYNWNASSGAASDAPGNMRLSRVGGGVDTILPNTPFVAQHDYARLLLYKTSPDTALVGDVKITNLSLSYAIADPYTPFVGVQEISLSAGQSQTVELDSFDGYATVISQTANVPATLQYTRDLSKTIENLTKKIADLQTAIAT